VGLKLRFEFIGVVNSEGLKKDIIYLTKKEYKKLHPTKLHIDTI
jgi:hypothetical protein